MSFQIRATAPEDSVLGREIARKLETVALELLAGVPPERYPAGVERYQTLLELMTFMEERADALKKGDDIDDD